ncbi:F0F1 ATP synthase subunit A [Tuberibacillus sp. Marseille-P3662]|uniref:F0F1 ATP synthase subunit A n=1 Tax=Tuberibacillus sp. Marseille-P3662 TaxID=1965358 RepID=UPI000A1CC5A5|nr:F0F1 ATP synthase subunit A [Tuberibacillus sp. Marseille-P3662]
MGEEFSPRSEFLGMTFDLPLCLMIVITALLVFLFIVITTKNMTSGVPKGKQNLFEWVVDFTRGVAEQFMEKSNATKFLTLAFTLLLYILFSNLLELFFMITLEYHHTMPGLGITEEVLREHNGEVPVTWWKSPTTSISVTFALALSVLVYSHYLGIRRNPKEYFKNYFQPYKPVVILHLMEDLIIKPLTLPLRLFGNIFAGEVLIVILLESSIAISTVPLFLWLGYSVFVAGVQAYIFISLSLVYIAEKVEPGH